MERKVKTIKTFLEEAWNEKIDTDFSHFSDLMIVDSPLGVRASVEEFKKIITTWQSAFPDIHIEDTKYTQDGDDVIAEWDCFGTQEAPFKEIPRTGKSVHYPGKSIFTFHGDSVVRYSGEVDLNLIYKQLGHLPKPDEYPQQSVLEKDETLLANTLQQILPGPFSIECIKSFCLYIVGFSAAQITQFLKTTPSTTETHLDEALSHLGCLTKKQCQERMYEDRLIPLLQDLATLLLKKY